jgi:glycosyltransferase involved in cell wall biosynthesis
MSSKTKVGVGIPCYKPHLATLWRLLDSIATQTVVPDIVVVETSSTSDVDVDASKLGHYGFELHVIAVPERRNASENRNATIQLLLDNNCTIISMLDADDIMHPQRMEFVHAAIDAGAEIVLHNFTSDMTGAV